MQKPLLRKDNSMIKFFADPSFLNISRKFQNVLCQKMEYVKKKWFDLFYDLPGVPKQLSIAFQVTTVVLKYFPEYLLEKQS